MMGGMIMFTVLYPKTDDSRFDHEYYAEKHIPLVRARCGPMGLVGSEFMRGMPGPDGSAPMYELIGSLIFESAETMQGALAANTAELMADVPNFTNIQPVAQIFEPVGR
jgi:uncharacterized protein (TIGR02118 family)